MQDRSKYRSEGIKFTFAVLSISSISRVAFTIIGSVGVHTCSIYVTRVISFTLVNICKIINIKKIVIGKTLPSVSLDALVLLSCVCRRKHHILPVTRFFLGSPKFKYVVLSCKLNPSSQLRFLTTEYLFDTILSLLPLSSGLHSSIFYAMFAGKKKSLAKTIVLFFLMGMVTKETHQVPVFALS